MSVDDLAKLGYFVIVAIGAAAFILLNFAVYYFPTQYAVKRAGRDPLPVSALVRGFLGMILAACAVGAALGILFQVRL